MNTTFKFLKINFLLILISSALAAQNNFLKAVSSLESFYNPIINQSTDLGYIITGVAFTGGGERVFLMKTDSSANVQWTYFYETNHNSNGSGVVPFQNGYLISGVTVMNNVIYSLLFKTDSLGTIEWTRAYGGIPHTEGSMKMILVRDKIFIAGLSTYPGPIYNNLDFGLKMLDSLGNILWSKTYGNQHSDYLTDFQKTNDGGFILCGSTVTGNDSLDLGILIVKTDSLGTMQWTKTYRNSRYQHSFKIIQDASGDYTIIGNYYEQSSSVSFLLHIDTIGQIKWAKHYRNIVNTSLSKINNENNLVAGYLTDSLGNILNSVVMETDSLGNLLWAKNYSDTLSIVWNDIIYNNDNGYTLAGMGNDVQGRSLVILKIDSFGFLECPYSDIFSFVTNISFNDTSVAIETNRNDSTITTTLPIIPIHTNTTTICNTLAISNTLTQEAVEIYPNPFSSQIYIKNFSATEEIMINVYNVLNKNVFFSKQNSTEPINLSSLNTGIYFVDIKWDNKNVRKIIVKI